MISSDIFTEIDNLNFTHSKDDRDLDQEYIMLNQFSEKSINKIIKITDSQLSNLKEVNSNIEKISTNLKKINKTQKNGTQQIIQRINLAFQNNNS